MGINPPRWTAEEFEREAAQAIRHFRETRMHEPLEAYLDYVEEYRRQVETLIEETVDLTRLSNLAVELLTNPQRLTAIRYLASPAISEDDLKVLADAALTPKRLNADPDMARRVIETVLMGLDRERFPWVAESREPTEGERATAVVSTAALIATQKVQTGRRNEAKKTQEGAVADALRAAGFTEVPTRAVTNMSHLPAHRRTARSKRPSGSVRGRPPGLPTPHRRRRRRRSVRRPHRLRRSGWTAGLTRTGGRRSRRAR